MAEVTLWADGSSTRSISDLLHRRRPEFLILTIDAQTTKTNGPVDRTDKNGDFKKVGEEGQGASRAPDCKLKLS